VTDTSYGMGLVGRVVQEHRRAVILLMVGLVVNLLLYAFIVRPLSQRVANVEQSTLTAEQSLAAAKAEHGRASGTLTGKDRASKELATFYSTVLAQDLSGARRLTYGRVQRLASQSNLQYQGSRYEPVEERTSSLTKLKTSVELTGSYNNMRSFIHAIETAPEFVVIENITLGEGTGEGSLRLALQLSTYFRSTE
jgi:Tfp pilus assembly protein PilO